MEACRVSSIGERLNRIEEAFRKRTEANSAFIASTQEAFEGKQFSSAQNREAHLNELKRKIAEHVRFVYFFPLYLVPIY